MRQLLHHLGNGDTQVSDVPAPIAKPGCLLIRTHASAVSLGTERMLIEFGKANLVEKARQQPDKVKQVVEKIKTDGLGPTLTAVRSKLTQPIPLGYSNSGVVIEVGAGVEGFSVGDRVISNGPHAEIVCVPANLCCKIPVSPNPISDEEAAFTVIASVGLQGIRLAQPTLGESFVVTGLGIIGLITVQLLKSHGCRVLGLDFDPSKLALAKEYGAEVVDLGAGEHPVQAALAFTKGRGVDGVLITASTKSSEPVSQATKMCRKRGRIILVGVTGLELSRADFYEKELSFQVSCSYGPGRYDVEYEQKGLDYPIGYVRWTEGRNFEAILDMLAEGRLDFSKLISKRYPIEKAAEAYQSVVNDNGVLGIVLTYPVEGAATSLERTIPVNPSRGVSADGCVVGLIGAGNYTMQVLLPAIKRTGALLHTVASSGGVSGVIAARKYGFLEATTEVRSILENEDINTVFIATRHDSHARLVTEALKAGKNVFVEKPLATTREQIREIKVVYDELLGAKNPPLLGIGFNRRFAPHIVKMKSMLDTIREPKTLIMTVNAGDIPPDHWTQDPQIGGGRIVGEGCHFVDLLRFIVGSPITAVQAMKISGHQVPITEDKMTFTLGFADGSVGTVHYFANGSKAFPKERLEVFASGRILVMDNYRTMKGYGWPGFRGMKLSSQDKGHDKGVAEFISAIKAGGPSPIPFGEIIEVSQVVLDIVEAANR